MLYDLSMLPIWFAVALALGGLVGWTTFSAGPQQPWFLGWFRIALILFGLGAVLAMGHILAGRAQFWLEIALLAFAAYMLGAVIGGALRGAWARPSLAD